jgi:uncharacterized protein YgfB (UPF0149 family)
MRPGGAGDTMPAPLSGVVKTSDAPLTDADLPSFAAVAEALRAAGAAADVAEAHGSLCGLACVLGEGAAAAWFAESLGLDPAAEAPVLADLARGTAAALAADDLHFTPLLPAEPLPLVVRARGLAEWCHGFTLGLAAGAGRAGNGALLGGSLVREILGDLGELARASAADEGASAEEGEQAYAELVEFVRVSVQLVFAELAPGRAPSPRPVLH